MVETYFDEGLLEVAYPLLIGVLFLLIIVVCEHILDWRNLAEQDKLVLWSSFLELLKTAQVGTVSFIENLWAQIDDLLLWMLQELLVNSCNSAKSYSQGRMDSWGRLRASAASRGSYTHCWTQQVNPSGTPRPAHFVCIATSWEVGLITFLKRWSSIVYLALQVSGAYELTSSIPPILVG